ESSQAAYAARPGLLKKYGWPSESAARRHVKVYDNGYEEMLDDPNVEGVIVALPLHLHAEASIKAMAKGKHVLCEKLMAQTVHECKEMARASSRDELDKVLSVGHQRHYSVLYDDAAEQIRRGLIGDLHHIRARWHRGNLPGRDSWQPPLPNESMKKQLANYHAQIDLLMKDVENMPAALQVDRDRLDTELRIEAAKYLDHQVDAAKFGYQGGTLSGGGNSYEYGPLEELIRWRLFNRTGGGLMAELGSHQLDAASIFISCLHDPDRAGNKVHPLSVNAVGGRHTFPLDREVDDHVYCSFEFPAPGYDEKANPHKKIVVTYSSINGNGFEGYGETVMGTTGTLLIEQEAELLYVPAGGVTKTSVKATKGGGPTLDTTQSGGYVAAEKQTGDSGPVSRGYTEEIEHWAWCIREKQRDRYTDAAPRCGPKVALADAAMALVSNMSIEEERRIDFEPAWFDVDSDETPEGVTPDLSRSRYKI
ncbi:MAG: Gfo/Idh/MocA family oxidoreductase, partial [Pirellulales bacterium]